VIRAVGAREASELIAKAGLDVIDVREPHEWATGHIPGARLVPLGQFRADPEGAQVGRRVLFVCERGGRSRHAAEIADTRGVAEVFSLDDGTLGWRAAGLPVEVPESVPAEANAVAELDTVVSTNVKELRAQRGYSLDVLAGLSGVGRQMLGQIELGRAVPNLGTLWKIARAFEVPFSALLAGPHRGETRIFRAANHRRRRPLLVPRALLARGRRDVRALRAVARGSRTRGRRGARARDAGEPGRYQRSVGPRSRQGAVRARQGRRHRVHRGRPARVHQSGER